MYECNKVEVSLVLRDLLHLCVAHQDDLIVCFPHGNLEVAQLGDDRYALRMLLIFNLFVLCFKKI